MKRSEAEVGIEGGGEGGRKGRERKMERMKKNTEKEDLTIEDCVLAGFSDMMEEKGGGERCQFMQGKRK